MGIGRIILPASVRFLCLSIKVYSLEEISIMPPSTASLVAPDGTIIYVETVEIGALPVLPGGQVRRGVEGQVTEIGFSDTLSMLRNAVSTIGGALRGALGDARPDEMTVDLTFALKGEVNIIPVLMRGSGEGSIKVGLKWTRSSDAVG